MQDSAKTNASELQIVRNHTSSDFARHNCAKLHEHTLVIVPTPILIIPLFLLFTVGLDMPPQVTTRAEDSTIGTVNGIPLDEKIYILSSGNMRKYGQ